MSTPAKQIANPAGWLDRICWTTLRTCAISLSDQSLVSGTRFLTTILIGSYCGAEELGLYALGFSLLMALHAVQLAVFSRPYTILGAQKTGRRQAELAGSVLIHFAVFGVVIGFAFAVAAELMHLLRVDSALIPILQVLSVAAPLTLLREHLRQFYFAHLRVATTAALDLAATAVQVAGLLWLACMGQLSSVTAFATVAAACGATSLAWLWMSRDVFRVCMAQIVPDLRRHWKIGRWDCASEMTFAVQTFGITWLLAWLLDTRSVGIYAACMTIIQLLNPFLLGMSSVLVPKTAKAFAQDGLTGVRSIVRNTTLGLGTLTALFTGFAFVWGGDVLELLYRGQGFAIDNVVVAALAFGVFVEVLGMGSENALWAMERHDLNFRMNLVGFLATFGSGLLVVPTLGLLGAAVAFCCGRLATSVAQCWAFHHACRN